MEESIRCRSMAEKENIVPSDEQVFHSLYPPKGELRWQTLEADSDQVEVNYEGINWDTLTNGWAASAF